MSEVIRIGVAGLGRTGWGNHVQRLVELPERFKLEAVSDLDESRLLEAKEQYGPRGYRSFEELIGDEAVEVVVVATPSHMHCEQTVAALEAGKHVVCEKPMAPTLAEADRMIAAANASGKVLTVFHNNHYAPDLTRIKEILASGVLGKVVLIKMRWSNFGLRTDWQTLRKFGGGNLNNTGPHPVEQAIQLFGEAEEPEVFCDMGRYLCPGDTDDHVKIILRGETSPMIDLEISSISAYNDEKWNIMGSCGGLAGSGSELRWKYFDPAEVPEVSVDEGAAAGRQYSRTPLPWKDEIVEEVTYDKIMPGGSVGEFYRNLHAHLTQGVDLAISPAHARRVMATIQKCHDLSDHRIV